MNPLFPNPDDPAVWIPTDPEHKKGLNTYAACGCDFKKCCKKYKKGKRCKKCPKG